MRGVDARLEELIEELYANFALCARNSLEDLKLVRRALDLRNCESALSLFFKGCVLGRRRRDIVEDTLVDGEVHKFDAKLTLDFRLFFNGVLDDHAHLLNGVHLCLLCHEDPILEHLIEVKRALAHVFEL